MKAAIKLICLASLALFGMGCADALEQPIAPEEGRSAQQLDLQNANIERVRPELVEPCKQCYEVVLMRSEQAQSASSDDGDKPLRFDKRQVDRTSNAFDGDPVPWPLDEKRED